MSSQLEDGIRAFNDGDLEAARILLAAPARFGNVHALYLMGVIWLDRGNLVQATSDLTESALEGNRQARELLHDTRFALSFEDFPYWEEDEAVAELWEEIKEERATRQATLDDNTNPPETGTPPPSTIVIDGVTPLPSGLEPTRTHKLEALQQSAKEHNEAVAVNEAKAKSGALQLVAFTIAAGIPAYFIGGQLGGLAFICIWGLLYVAVNGIR